MGLQAVLREARDVLPKSLGGIAVRPDAHRLQRIDQFSQARLQRLLVPPRPEQLVKALGQLPKRLNPGTGRAWQPAGRQQPAVLPLVS
jgi:hypothetical protein